MVELSPLIQCARCSTSITSLYYHVHCPQGCTAQTFMGPLQGAVLWFSMWGSCIQTKYPLVHSPIQKSTIETTLMVFQSIPEIICVWQICDGSNKVSSHCIPHENAVQA